MRDINRIDSFCDELAIYWKMMPDIRFMQLICNFQAWLKSDGFYLEDEDVMRKFRLYIKEVFNR